MNANNLDQSRGKKGSSGRSNRTGDKERIIDNNHNKNTSQVGSSEFNAKLVIIDSIISLHRAEFAGRGTLADRQQRLNSILHKLIRLAEIFNIVIVITNQVQSSPDTFFGDPTKAAGGNVIGHTSTYRIYLRKSGENRIAKMIDSPYHPYSDIRFTINLKGIDDLEDSTNREKELEGGSD